MSFTARAPRQGSPSSFAERIRDHIERDEVGAARRVLAEARREGANEPALDAWETVLAPAKILARQPATGTDLRTDLRWIAEHAQEYRGQWVAVLAGKLLAHSEDHEELRARLAAIAPTASPLVHFID